MSRLISKAAVILALILLPGLSAQAVDLDSLFVQSVGGPQAVDKLRQIQTVHTEGSVLFNGVPGTYESYFMAPDRFYLETDLGQIRLIQAYDGAVAWQMDANGFVSQLDGYERRQLLDQIYFESYSYLLKDRLPGGAAYIGLTETNDTGYYEVAIYPLNLDTVHVYFDTASAVVRKIVTKLDNLQMISTPTDYRETDGILMAYRTRTSAVGAPVQVEMTMDSIRFDEPFDTTVFQMPRRQKQDYHFPANADSVTIPFVFTSGHIYVRAVVNGKQKAWFILDSGASANVFNQHLAKKLGLPVVGSTAAKGIGGYDKVALVETDSVVIGSLVLLNQVSGSLDLELIGAQAPKSYAFGGVLGYDFLSRFPIKINYYDSTMTVYDPKTFTLTDTSQAVPFTLTMNIPTIQAELNGIPGKYIVDLGNALGLIIHQKFAEEHNLEKKLADLRDMRGEFGGVGEAVGGKSAYAASFSFGDVRITDIRVIIPTSSQGLSGSSELAGNIGNLVLENFRVLFDYADRRLVFYPAEPAGDDE